MDHTLVIGLDFGTTYSAVAYCETAANVSKGPEDVQLISSWPGLSNASNEKVPSRISYGPPPRCQVQWGNQIRHTTKDHVHALMKLKLDEKRFKKSKQLQILLAFLTSRFGELDMDDNGESSEEEGPPAYPGKDTVDVVADYLSEIKKHVWQELEKVYKSTFHTIQKQLVVTVPAVWSERAKDLTLKAVTKAQFDAEKIMLVTEPEAAAVYTLRGMTDGANRNEIEVGDNFVLCDAGGGTVDLISYRVTQISPIFKIEEAAVGTGDKCGATYVDKEFITWLEKWIGREAYLKIPPAKLRHGAPMMNSFETCKFHFSGEEDELDVTLPKECEIDDDEEKNIADRVLTIKSDHIKEMFDPCVKRIIELIDGQVNSVINSSGRKPKFVIVVGGFGRNAYLFKCVTDYCQKRGIGTRLPNFPWSAVVRGAVCRGLEGPASGLVGVRLARKHYGTYASEPFIAAIHHPDDMYVEEFTGQKYAKAQMTWLVGKSERLPEPGSGVPKKAEIEVCRRFSRNEERMFGAVLVGCDEEVAPRRYVDPGAYNICRVTADLSTVPESKFMLARSSPHSDEYFIAEFKLEATFVGGMIHWKLIFDGQEYGSVSVSYDRS